MIKTTGCIGYVQNNLEKETKKTMTTVCAILLHQAGQLWLQLFTSYNTVYLRREVLHFCKIVSTSKKRIFQTEYQLLFKWTTAID
jgi:uncharacterized protein YrrD